MVTVPCPVTVAAGVLAPGHLGELTRYLPFELVDNVLEMTGAVQKRTRMLPSRAGMYFILAMTLFPGIRYLRVWDKLTCALDGLGLPRPSEKSLRDLRRRLGPASAKACSRPSRSRSRRRGPRVSSTGGCAPWRSMA
jgi:Insertion element 4 transposase N-terminal